MVASFTEIIGSSIATMPILLMSCSKMHERGGTVGAPIKSLWAETTMRGQVSHSG